MTSDDAWTGPACQTYQGRGQMVLTRGNYWTGTTCTDCHGTGHVNAAPPVHYREDGTRIPENGELYDEAVHGSPGLAFATSDALGCRVCLGADVVVSPTLIEGPCPACIRR